MGNSQCVCLPKKNKRGLIPSQKFISSEYFDRLTPAQVTLIKSKFDALQHQGLITFNAFSQLLPTTVLPESIRIGAFRAFAPYNNRNLNFQQLCLGVSKYILGDPSEKALFLFLIFDQESKGYLSPRQTVSLFKFIDREIPEDFLRSNIALDQFLLWIPSSNIDLNSLIEPFQIIPIPATELSSFNKALQQAPELAEGQVWNVISKNWMDAWRRYINSPDTLTERPVEIDNKNLLDPQYPISLREDISQENDFELIPKKAWDLLKEWYNGGPSIERFVTKEQDELFIDLYPQIMKIFTDKDLLWMTVSKKKLVIDLVRDLGGHGKLFEVKENLYKELSPCMSIEDCHFDRLAVCVLMTDEDRIPMNLNEDSFDIGETVEVMEKGFWQPFSIEESSASMYTLSRNNKTISIDKNQRKRIRKPSRTPVKDRSKLKSRGIYNIGNTCYMASVLQCLVHTPLLSAYFIEEFYHNSLNRRKDGLIAREFARMLKSLAKGKTSSQLLTDS